VAVSPCGSFALVGSVGGSIDMFNLQSGMPRQRFPSKLTPAQARQVRLRQLKQADDVARLQPRSRMDFPPGTGRHTKAVTGIVVDPMNETVISCSLDGTVKFWDFVTGNLVDQIDWAPMIRITGCRYHAANDLVAFSCDDHAIRVVDAETKNTIRAFWGCQEGINDICFSNDGRWIVAASKDSMLRIWDLPTGHLIDAMRLEKACKSLAFSTSGEYLATATEGELGVNIWTNKSLFRHVQTRQISEKEISKISGPTESGEGGEGLVEAAFEEDAEPQHDDGAAPPTVDQLSADIVTLSLVPKSRWQTLLHLDLIKQRNKPKEPPKAPEKAPFFLGSVNGLIGDGQDGAGRDKGTDEPRSRLLKFEASRSQQAFTSRLLAGGASGNYDDFMEHLKSLSSSGADLELRSLGVGDGDDASNELLHFIRALSARLVARRDYELAQAWMTVFLRLHVEDVMGSEVLLGALRDWRALQERERSRLDELVGYCGGVVGFLRSPRT